MDLNLEGLTGLPATAIAAFNAAASILDAAITDNIVVNVQVNWTGSGGGASAGPVSAFFTNYTTFYSAITSLASIGDSTFKFLPTTSYNGGVTQIAVWNAEEKALGLMSASATALDGTATFSTDISASLLVGVALHEFTHAMGRTPYGNLSGTMGDVFGLYRFTSAGNTYQYGGIPAAASYFSINNGINKWADYGENSDPSDFLNDSLTTNDPFNEFYNSSTFQYLTPADLEQLDALGFHLKFDTTTANTHDFNGDNNSDVLVQSSGGQIAYANMSAGAFQNWVTVVSTPGYNVVGTGKISGRVTSDIVLQNSSGQIVYENMTSSGTAGGFVAVTTVPNFTVRGVGDINNDRFADIVIENTSTGQIEYANMNGSTFHNLVNVTTVAGWTAEAVADINYDGYEDIVIENTSTGQIVYANMNNGAFTNFGAVASAPGFTVMGAGNISRTGDADIVVENLSTGQIAYANMVNGAFAGWVGVATAPSFTVTAVEDVNGDGYDDIVVQNTSTGQLAYANMSTGTFQGWVGIGSTPGFTGHTDPGNSDAPAALTSLSTYFATGPTPTTPPSVNFGTPNNGTSVIVSDPGMPNRSPGPNMFDPGTPGFSGPIMHDPGAPVGVTTDGSQALVNWLRNT